MDEASDLSRRIDELLSGAIDEQVREQRALAELMIGVRDGLAQLSDRIASVNDSVEAAREASERIQLAPAAAPAIDGMAERFESIETAIGELSATIAALADRPDPAMLDPEEARALFGTTAEAAREAATGEAAALRSLIESSISSLRNALTSETTAARDHVFGELMGARESLLAETTAMKESADTRHQQIAEKLEVSAKRVDEFESRLAAIEASLAEFGKTPGELRETITGLMGDARKESEGLLERIRAAGDASSARLAETATKLSDNSTMIVAALDTIAARFETLQESLLAYLQVRDVALEEERDRVITELLEEFARAMDAKQRPAFAAGIRGAWASRRDRKDAHRFRAGAGKELPKMPPVSQQAARLATEKLARPVEPAAGTAPAAPAMPEPAASRTESRPRPVPVEPLAPRPAKATAPAPGGTGSKKAPPAKKVAKTPAVAKAPAKKAPARTRRKPGEPPAADEEAATPSVEDIGVPSDEALTTMEGAPEATQAAPDAEPEPAPDAEAAPAAEAAAEPAVAAGPQGAATPEAEVEAAPAAPESGVAEPEPEIRLGPVADLSAVQPAEVEPPEELSVPGEAEASEEVAEAPAEAPPAEPSRPTKASRRAAKKSPVDKRTEKLERAARRRAGQRPQAPRTSPLPPPPGERSFEPPESS